MHPHIPFYFARWQLYSDHPHKGVLPSLWTFYRLRRLLLDQDQSIDNKQANMRTHWEQYSGILTISKPIDSKREASPISSKNCWNCIQIYAQQSANMSRNSPTPPRTSSSTLKVASKIFVLPSVSSVHCKLLMVPQWLNENQWFCGHIIRKLPVLIWFIPSNIWKIEGEITI